MAEETVYYTPRRLAEFLDVPLSTLEFWRHNGAGPKFSYMGRHVRYHRDDVAAWAEDNKRERSEGKNRARAR